ncbi:SdpI family protein [Flavisolibacter ginsenosidimutans]|uniref:DUF1648 domain-containing protein n=1 Tax=Flavisolibacter ginsenosidimutans TaxID=661481 RepID=A0A5B8UL89_9BACT|nr:SdpI family protein [Flavisolibacter ginsenosidimutans]QEC57437.1 DUF1648 domain-containing protein [Flavisolibacter ginsenosidimutans]
MKKNLLPWIVVLVALLPAVYLLLIWPSMPQTVPVHFGADMKPDRLGDKDELWLTTGILAVVSIVVYFLLINLHRFDPKRKDAAQSATFQKLAGGTVIFIAALNFLILNSAKGGTTIQSFLFPLLGLMFAFIGNYMNHIKPNYFAGIRLPWTLNNDENWRRTHQLGGKLWFAGGLLIAVVCLFLKPPASFIFFIVVIVVMVFIPVVYSYRLYKKGF